MSLEPEQRRDLERSNDRIAIVGRWTSRPEAVYRFSNSDPSADGTVRVVDLFEILKPHVKKKPQGLRIGDVSRGAYVLGPPDSAGEDLWLVPDSDLLQGGTADPVQAQKSGGEQLKRLIDALDGLIPFAGSRFSSRLLAVAKGYLHESAQQFPGHSFPNPARLKELVDLDHTLGELLVRFLTCYEADESEIRGRIRTRFNELASEKVGEGVFTDEVKTEQIPGMLEALDHCRSTLFDGPSVDGQVDEVWKIAISDEEAHVDLGLETTDLFDLYREFRRLTADLHRLVRTEPLHASIVLWLFSKYRVGDAFRPNEEGEAAGGAFEVGVEAWDKERVRALTPEQVEEFTARAEAASVDLANIPASDEFFRGYLKEIGLYAVRILRPSRSYTKEDLEQRALDLFVALAERAGEVGKMLTDVKQRLKKLKPAGVALLNLDEGATPKEMAELLDKKLAEAGDDIPQSFDRDRVEGGTKDEFLNSFVEELSRSGKQDLAAVYSADLDQIEKNRTHFKTLYLAFRGGAAAASTEDAAGTAGVGLADVTLRADDQRAAERVAKKAELLHSLAGATRAKKTQPSTATTASDETRETTEPQPEADDPSEPSPPTPTEPEIDVEMAPADSVESADSVADITLPVDPRQVLKELPSFAKTQDAILSYVGSSDGEAYRGHLQALILSEFILASPARSTSLGEHDLSNLLGLLVDIVEHTGEARRENGERFYGPGRDKKDLDTLGCLKEINLSRYFPAETSLDLQQVISWLRRLNGSFAKVSPYLEEVRCLRDAFQLLDDHGDSQLEVVVVDDTVKGIAGKSKPSESILVQEKPGLLYLSGLAGSGLDELAKRLRRFVDLGLIVQVPMVISDRTLGKANRLPTLTPIDLAPVVSGGRLNLETMSSLVAETPEGQGKSEDSRDDGSRSGHVTLASLPPVLFLALAPRLEETKLGRIELDSDVDLEPFPEPQYDEYLCSYLRRLWLHPTILEPYLSSRWLSVASVSQLKWDQLRVSVGQQVERLLEEPEDRRAVYQYLPLSGEHLRHLSILAGSYQDGQLGEAPATGNFGAKVIEKVKFGKIDWLASF